MALTITQGDYIYYQDASTGSPTGWNWTFPGGTPTGATATNPIVQYLSPSSLGYDAELQITKGAISVSKVENNIIIVNPESISVSLTNSYFSQTIPMGTSVTYSALGATGNLSYYNWSIAGVAGFTGTNPYPVSSILSWSNLTGSEIDPTYTTYLATSSVTFNSNLGNTATSTTSVTYSKNGPAENYNYLSSPPYTLGVNYYDATDTGIPTSSIGMSGSGTVFLIDTNYATSNPIDNTSFRAQGEVVTYWTSSLDVEFISGRWGMYPGQFVVSSDAFNVLGVTYTGWEGLPRYIEGQYMIPGDMGAYFSNKFYFADVSSYGNSLVNTRFWDSYLVPKLLINDYTIGYQSSRGLELSWGIGAAPAAFTFGLDGAGGASGPQGGACFPSSSLAGSDVEIYITLKFSPDGSINGIDPGLDFTMTIQISTMANPIGNSPDGQLVFMQDTTDGTMTGVATLMNDLIGSFGFGSNILVEASPDYSWLSAWGIYDINTFNGLKISIISRDATGAGILQPLTQVVISDNSPWGPYPMRGFPTYSGESNWAAFNTNRISNPYQLQDPGYPEAVRGWYFGQ